jgi:dihydroflavonol-4-reductase
MIILITGINGLVGSVIAAKFLKEGYTVRGLIRPNASLELLEAIKHKIDFIEGDILDVLSLENAVKGVDYVINTAAMVSFSPKERKQMFKVNVEGTANVVNACLSEKNVKKLCHISSIAALGRPETLLKNPNIEINENQKWEESAINSNYAKSKYLSEIEVWRGQSEGLNTVILNPSVVLGAGEWDKSSTQLFKYVWDGNLFYTQGSLNYVDVEDLAKITVKMTLSEISNQRFVVSGGKVTYLSFFTKIAQRFNKKAPRFLLKTSLINILWRLEALKAFLTRKSPLITKETSLSSQMNITYPSDKLMAALGFKFKTLDETLDLVCENLMKKSL